MTVLEHPKTNKHYGKLIRDISQFSETACSIAEDPLGATRSLDMLNQARTSINAYQKRFKLSDESLNSLRSQVDNAELYLAHGGFYT